MNRNTLSLSMLWFATTGTLVSASLSYLSHEPPPSCLTGYYSIGLSCDELFWSEYTQFYGVSVALLGLAWFVIVLGLIVLARHDERFMRSVVAWSILGGAGVVGFVYNEILIGSTFPLWTTAHLMVLAILVFSIVSLRVTHEPHLSRVLRKDEQQALGTTHRQTMTMAGNSNALDWRPEREVGFAKSALRFVDYSLPEVQAQIVRRLRKNG